MGTGDVLDGTDGFGVDTLAPAPGIPIDPVTNAITIDLGKEFKAGEGSPLTAVAPEGFLDLAKGEVNAIGYQRHGRLTRTRGPAGGHRGGGGG
ncbi:hypothetical protein UL83_03510, partial [Acinetobacter baumannii]